MAKLRNAPSLVNKKRSPSPPKIPEPVYAMIELYINPRDAAAAAKKRPPKLSKPEDTGDDIIMVMDPGLEILMAKFDEVKKYRLPTRRSSHSDDSKFSGDDDDDEDDSDEEMGIEGVDYLAGSSLPRSVSFMIFS